MVQCKPVLTHRQVLVCTAVLLCTLCSMPAAHAQCSDCGPNAHCEDTTCVCNASYTRFADCVSYAVAPGEYYNGATSSDTTDCEGCRDSISHRFVRSSSQYAHLNVDYTENQNQTFVLWFKMNTAATVSQYLFMEYDGSAQDKVEVYIQSDERWNANYMSNLLYSNDIIIPGIWTNVALRINGASLHIFRDAIMFYSKTVSLYGGKHRSGLVLGAKWSGMSYSNFFDGWIADFRIHTHALSDAAISQIHLGTFADFGTVLTSAYTCRTGGCMPDQCALETDNCGSYSVCTDNGASFSCVCDAGAEGFLACPSFSMSSSEFVNGATSVPLTDCSNCLDTSTLQFNRAQSQYTSMNVTRKLVQRQTYSVWIKLASTGNTMYVLHEYLTSGSSATTATHLYIKSTRYVIGAYTAARSIESVGKVTAGAWTHIVYRISQANHELHINGQFDKSVSISALDPLDMDKLYIGAQRGSGVVQNYFNGLIADFRIYSKLLESSEITALYQGTFTSAFDVLRSPYACNVQHCSDIDECALDIDNCDSVYATCANTNGSFACTCVTGYETANGGVDCTNIDECTAGTHDCDAPHTICVDTVGSFTCTCDTGYTRFADCVSYAVAPGEYYNGATSSDTAGCEGCRDSISHKFVRSSSQYAELVTSYTETQNQTYSLWFKMQSINTQDQTLVFECELNDWMPSNIFLIKLTSAEYLAASYNGETMTYTTERVPPKTWLHTAVRIENTTMDLFIMGVKVQSSAISLHGGMHRNRLYMGANRKTDYNGYDKHFDGWIADFRIHTLALSDSAILQIHHATFADFGTVLQSAYTCRTGGCMPDQCALATDNCGDHSVCAENGGSFTCACEAGSEEFLACQSFSTADGEFVNGATSVPLTDCSNCLDNTALQFVKAQSQYINMSISRTMVEWQSVSVWIKPASLGSNMYVFTEVYELDGTVDYTSGVMILWSKYVQGKYLTSAVTSDSTLNVNEWVYITYVQIPMEHSLYLNGAIHSTSGTAQSSGYAHHRLYMGAERVTGTVQKFFDGMIADFRIYSRPLRTSEITELYQGTFTSAFDVLRVGYTCNVAYCNGTNATDVDECVLETDNCDALYATCADSAGSFTCSCITGYETANNGVTCTNIDECTAETDNCGPNSVCTDTVGSFSCSCNTSYTRFADCVSYAVAPGEYYNGAISSDTADCEGCRDSISHSFDRNFNQYAELVTDYNETQNQTYVLWFNMQTNFIKDQTLVYECEVTDGLLYNIFSIVITFAENLKVSYNGNDMTYTTVKVAPMTWIHTAVRINGAVMDMFFQGAHVQSLAIPQYGGMHRNRLHLGVGRKTTGYDFYFNGRIADFRIHTLALSDDAISQMYYGTFTDFGTVLQSVFPCRSGGCMPDQCALESDNCGDHSVCTENGGSFTCACDTGYDGFIGCPSFAMAPSEFINGVTSVPLTDCSNCLDTTALQFDKAQSQHVNMTISRNAQQWHTYSVWIKAVSLGSDMCIYQEYQTEGTGANYASAVYILSGANVRMQYKTYTNDGIILLNANEWVHIVHKQVPAKQYLYLNNVADGIDSVAQDDGYTRDRLYLGAERGSGVVQNYFDGLIADFRIYSRPLESPEITELYQGTFTSAFDVLRVAYTCNVQHCSLSDVDECGLETDNCDASYAICSNTVGSFTCACITGYETNNSGVNCTNIDECTAETDNCDALYATCADSAGSFTCSCITGYETANSGVTCTNIDECTTETDNCDALYATCADSAGSFTCSCITGYETANSGVTCTNIDECTAETDNCDPVNATCADSAGSFTCSCITGYETVNSGVTCTNIDECTAETDNCDALYATCADSAGSFTCSCITGYETANSGVTCTNIDECTAETDNCDPVNATCADTAGSFTCTCLPGYGSSNNGETCLSLNECSIPSHNCDATHAICTESTGSFICTCVTGYETVDDGVTCTNIDECLVPSHNCDGNATCADTAGSFSCSCNTGFAGNGLTCSDVNECNSQTHNCAEAAVCTDMVGSFTCACLVGYETNNSGVNCTNIDECTTGADNCDPVNATCADTSGSFTCTCLPGYGTLNNGETCLSLDECSIPSHNCDATHAICTDTTGSFTCTCVTGYETNNSGVTCTNIDECLVPSHNCDALYATCDDTSGSFTCTCIPGYETIDNGVTCTEFDECVRLLHNCGDDATCENVNGSFTCTCNSGFDGFHPCVSLEFDGSMYYGNASNVEISDCAGCLSSHAENFPYPNTDSYILDNVSATYVDTQQETYSWFMKPLSELNDPRAFYWFLRGPSANQWMLSAFTSGGYPGFKSVGVVDYTLGNQKVPLNQWSHLALRTEPTQFTMFLNGVQVAQVPVVDNSGHTRDHLIVGSTRDWNGYHDPADFFSGQITDLRVYSRPLSDTEIAQLSNGTFLDAQDVKMDTFRCRVRNCTNVDECTAGTDNCDSVNATCADTVGSFTCTCFSGFETTNNGVTCIDINECSRQTHNCGEGAVCTNTAGSFTCACAAGYEGFYPCVSLDFDASMYYGSASNVEISDCAACLSSCAEDFPYPNTDSYILDDVNAAFVNTQQETYSWFVKPLAHDPDTFPTTFYWFLADDPADLWIFYFVHYGGYPVIDIFGVIPMTFGDQIVPLNQWSHIALRTELSQVTMFLNGVQVAQVATWDNTGRFRDSLMLGSLQNYGGFKPPEGFFSGQIADLRVYSRPLSDTEIAQLSSGTFLDAQDVKMDTFKCRTRNCSNTDECTAQTDNCDALYATCADTSGSFTCTCIVGYGTADNGVTCTNVNECTTETDNCDALYATCADTTGSFTCTCLTGYETVDSGVTCTNIDECTAQTDNCDALYATCADASGSFTCTCIVGYGTADNGVTCTNIDECTTETDNCDALYATCADTTGSFTCTCLTGYETVDSGVTCTNIDECTAQTDNCDALYATCADTTGSFTCTCITGHETTDGGVNCTEFDECVRLLHNCGDDATCENVHGSFTCTCNPGFDGFHPCVSLEFDGSMYYGNANNVEISDCAGCLSSHAENFPDPNTDSYILDNVSATYVDTQQETYSWFMKPLSELNSPHAFYWFLRGPSANQWMLSAYRLDGYPAFSSEGVVGHTLGDQKVPLNQWSHLALRTEPTQFTMFLNGVQVAQVPVLDNSGYTRDHLIVGSARDWSGYHHPAEFFSGQIADLRVYSRPLSDTEIAQLSNGTFLDSQDVKMDTFRCRIRNCTNVDECTAGTDNCDSVNATCADTVGSFTCTCFSGFETTDNGVTCIDINECNRQTHNCGEGAVCTNTAGSFTCACAAGYEGFYPCVSLEFDASMYYGSASNVEISDCAGCLSSRAEDFPYPNTDSYILDDVNAAFVHTQQETYSWFLKPLANDPDTFPMAFYWFLAEEYANLWFFYFCLYGGYPVVDIYGVIPISFGDQIMPLNQWSHIAVRTELSQVTMFMNGVQVAQVPAWDNTGHLRDTLMLGSLQYFGGFQPPAGFFSGQIADLRVYSRPLSDTEIAQLSSGTFLDAQDVKMDTFKCRTRNCSNTDECTAQTDNCDALYATCVDTSGSFTCTCVTGYGTADNGVTCTNINECTTETDNCDDLYATCADTTGSFTCTCIAGYGTADNGVTCTNTDECTLETDNCDSNAACSDTAGSFTCACDPGLTGSGVTCTNCPTDTFKATSGPGACQACPEFSSSAEASDELSDCVCNDGFIRSDPETCAVCPIGSFCVNGSNFSCPNGTASIAGASHPEHCLGVCGWREERDPVTKLCHPCGNTMFFLESDNQTDRVCNPCGLCLQCPPPINMWEYVVVHNNTCSIACRNGATLQTVKLSHTLRGNVSETCLPNPRHWDTPPGLHLQANHTDGNGTWWLNGTYYSGAHRYAVAYMWSYALDPYGVLRLPQNNPCVLNRSICCLHNIQQRYVVDSHFENAVIAIKNEADNSTVCIVSDSSKWVEEQLAELAPSQLSVIGETTWDILPDKQHGGVVHIAINTQTVAADELSDCSVQGVATTCQLSLGMLFVGSTQGVPGAEISAHVQQYDITLQYVADGVASISTSQQHSCLYASFIAAYRYADDDVRVLVDMLLDEHNSSFSTGEPVKMNTTVFRDSTRVALGPRGKPPAFQALPADSSFSFFVHPGILTVAIPISSLGVQASDVREPLTFQLQGTLRTSYCLDNFHLHSGLARLIDAVPRPAVQAAFSLTHMWTLSGLSTELPFQLATQTSIQADGTGLVFQHSVAYPDHKETRFALTAFASTVFRAENSSAATAFVNSLTVIHVRHSDDTDAVTADLLDSAGNPDDLRTKCLQTYAAFCMITHAVVNNVLLTPSTVISPDQQLCDRLSATWSSTHAQLVRATAMHSAWGHQRITEYLTHVCDFATSADTGLLFVATPGVQWPRRSMLPPGADRVLFVGQATAGDS